MKYTFCSIRFNVTKYDVTFAKEGSNPLPPRGYAMEVIPQYCTALSVESFFAIFDLKSPSITDASKIKKMIL